MTAAVALLAGLGFAAPAHADPPSYGSNGVFGVGDKPTNGWATASIPPGRYRVDQSPSMYPYLSPPGFLVAVQQLPLRGKLSRPHHRQRECVTGPEHIRRHPAHRRRGLAGQRHPDDRRAGMSESQFEPRWRLDLDDDGTITFDRTAAKITKIKTGESCHLGAYPSIRRRGPAVPACHQQPRTADREVGTSPATSSINPPSEAESLRWSRIARRPGSTARPRRRNGRRTRRSDTPTTPPSG